MVLDTNNKLLNAKINFGRTENIEFIKCHCTVSDDFDWEQNLLIPKKRSLVAGTNQFLPIFGTYI